MKKINLLIILCIVISNYCIAQSGSFFIENNYNNFNHSLLKSFQQESMNEKLFKQESKNKLAEIPMEINENFEGNYGFTIGYTMLRKEISVFLSYNSTIGSISYKDSSSEIKITTPLKGYTFGAGHLFKIIPDYDQFYLGLRVFATISTIEINSYSKIAENITIDTKDYQSIDAGLGLNLIYEYPIYYFKIRTFIGYDFVLGRQLKLNEDKTEYLENKGRDEVKTGWGGLRTGIGISIPVFPFVKKSERHANQSMSF